MIGSLAFIFIFGLMFAYMSEKLGLPRLVGMLIAGIVIGPYGLNLMDGLILSVSSQLRTIALIIILIKAGLSLKIDDIKKVGRPALLLSFLPALCEWSAYVIFAPKLLNLHWIDAALLGAVIAAVSPAVVVPRMVDLMDHQLGTDKRIPQMILAGASLDDVFVIVLFSSFLTMSQTGQLHLSNLLNIPSSIVLGIIFGCVAGLMVSQLLNRVFNKESNAMKPAIILLGISFLLYAIEQWCDGIVAVSGLLAVMSCSMVVAGRLNHQCTVQLQNIFGNIWKGAEIILFVLVGSAVNVGYMVNAGLMALLMLVIGLATRMLGVLMALVHTHLNKKEKMYCLVAYCPKATVQAAIGGVALALGLSCGNIILSCAVLSILITAPLGAYLMDKFKYRWLNQE